MEEYDQAVPLAANRVRRILCNKLFRYKRLHQFFSLFINNKILKGLFIPNNFVYPINMQVNCAQLVREMGHLRAIVLPHFF